LHKSQFHRIWQSFLLKGKHELIQDNAEKIVTLFRDLLQLICPAKIPSAYIAKDFQGFAAQYTMGNHIEGGASISVEKREVLLNAVGETQSESKLLPHTDAQCSVRVFALALVKGIIREELHVPVRGGSGSPNPKQSNGILLNAMGIDVQDNLSTKKQKIAKTTDCKGWFAGVQKRLVFPTDVEDLNGLAKKLHGNQSNLRWITVRPTVDGLQLFLKKKIGCLPRKTDKKAFSKEVENLITHMKAKETTWFKPEKLANVSRLNHTILHAITPTILNNCLN
jgi:hypothetical protein